MRHDWQLAFTPQPDLVTSTVHDPRTPAATSDLDANDPMAATPAGGHSSDEGRLVFEIHTPKHSQKPKPDRLTAGECSLEAFDDGR